MTDPGPRGSGSASTRARWSSKPNQAVSTSPLEHVEETIHRVVRLDDPNAAPPRLRIERPDESRVLIHYDSDRHMCEFAGIVLGLQKEYGQSVFVEDLACMHHGDAECTIEVRLSYSEVPVTLRRYYEGAL